MKGCKSGRLVSWIVIAAVVISGMLLIGFNNTREQSDTSVLLPTNYYDREVSGYLEVDGEGHHNVLVSSDLRSLFFSDGVYHNSVSVDLSPDWTPYWIHRTYEFVSETTDLVPIGWTRIPSSESTDAYTHEFEGSGDVLTMYFDGGVISRITFDGRTVVDSRDSSMDFAVFHVESSYKPDLLYAKDASMDLPEVSTFYVNGVEDGAELSGTVTIQPESRHRHYSENGNMGGVYVWSSLTADIDGSLLPTLIGGTQIKYEEGDGPISMNLMQRELCGDRLTTYRITMTIDGGALSLEGSVLVQDLDSSCAVVSERLDEFRYRGSEI